MLKIKIEQLKGKEAHPIAGGKEIGYPFRFSSMIGSGEALLVFGETGPKAQAGQEIEVSANPEVISDLRPLPPGEQAAPRLTALPTPGDFEATGQVRSVIWLSDEADEAVIEVQVGPLLFSVPAGESGAELGEQLEYGEWVQMRIQRLIWVSR